GVRGGTSRSCSRVRLIPPVSRSSQPNGSLQLVFQSRGPGDQGSLRSRLLRWFLLCRCHLLLQLCLLLRCEHFVQLGRHGLVELFHLRPFLFLVERSIRDDRLALSLGMCEDVLAFFIMFVCVILSV